VVGGLSDETCRPSLCTCHKKTFSRMEREGILKPSMAAMDCLLDLAVFLEQKIDKCCSPVETMQRQAGYVARFCYGGSSIGSGGLFVSVHLAL
jgi:hypothetical protein